MKLHLGCGLKYLEGYMNIDYPSENNHTVQKQSVADLHANLIELNYSEGTIDEIRLHHVFEHFSRAQAIALLVNWNSWLKMEGQLRIETPDFFVSAIQAINPFRRFSSRLTTLRHIFGSQEAHWANHFEGYSKELYKYILPKLGFKIVEINKNSWRGTYNIEIIAVKKNNLNYESALNAAKIILGNYKVDDSEGENLLLNYWISEFERIIVK